MKFICLKGHVLNVEGVFDVESDKISTIIKSTDGTFGLRGIFSGTFEAIGKVGILQLQRVLKYISSFTDAYDFKFTANKLVFKSNDKKISIPLQKADTIINTADASKFDKYIEMSKGVIFTLPKDIVASIVENFLLMEAKFLNLQYADKKLTLKLNHESTVFNSDLLQTYDLDLGEKEFNITISRYLVEVMSTVADSLQFQFAETDKPTLLVVIAKKANLTVEYIVNLINPE